MKRRDDAAPQVAAPKSLSEIPPNPESFDLFAGLESQQLQLQPTESSTTHQQHQQIAQSARPLATNESPSPAKSNRSLLIAVFVIAALIIGILIGFQFSHR